MTPRFFAITRAQREALFRVFQRDFPSWISPCRRYAARPAEYGHGGAAITVPTTQWRRFRRTVEPLIGGGGCVMVPWAGMWLGIETDGRIGS